MKCEVPRAVPFTDWGITALNKSFAHLRYVMLEKYMLIIFYVNASAHSWKLSLIINTPSF